MSNVREAIIATYAEWTAMSALRSGAPIKSRRDVYTALGSVDFAVLFNYALVQLIVRRSIIGTLTRSKRWSRETLG